MTRQFIDVCVSVEERVCFAGVPDLTRRFEVFLHIGYSSCIKCVYKAIKTQTILGFRIKSSQLFSQNPYDLSNMRFSILG